MTELSTEHAVESAPSSMAAVAERAGRRLPQQLVYGLNADEQTLLAQLDAALADAAALGIIASRHYIFSEAACILSGAIFPARAERSLTSRLCRAVGDPASTAW